MTKEEAIAVLQKIKPIPRRADGKSTTHILETIALDMAIKALSAEPCEDAVSKTSVFEILGNLMSIPYDFDRQITEKDVSESMDEIRALPPVKPQYTEAEIQKIQEMEQAQLEKAYEIGKVEQQRVGRWIDGFGGCKCSGCGCLEAGHSDYCPNCGAKMVERDDEE